MTEAKTRGGTMKRIIGTIAPRLPKEARDKLKKGGTHKNKKAYQRKEKHAKRLEG